MRQKFLLLAMLTCSLAWNTAKATETEPNNTKATANTLTLNGSNTGAIGAAADEDWWAVTTTSDGKLDVTINVSNGQYIKCYIYDNDGTTQLNYGETLGSTTVSTDGLATGTYYVKLVAYYGGGTPAYTISNALTVPAQTNDAEPNGTRALAKTFPLGGSRTGHINYYYNLARDTEDWYKVTTTGNGKLDITITSNNGQYMRVWLYDNDGTTQLNYAETNSTTVQSTNGLAAGTYYVKIVAYYSTGYIPYSISNTFTPPAQANDLEPNDTKAQALTLGLNNSTTGHIDYYYNNARDSSDWYKVTTTADGRLRLRVTSANGQYINCWLYDNNGTTQLNYTAINSTSDLNTDGLAAGTYYVLIKSYYNNGYVPYTLEDSLFSPTEPNDPEPDSTRALALTLPLNGSATGHINYYYNNHRDSADWYKVTTNGDGRLRLTMTSGNGQNVWAYLYDNDGTTQLAASYTSGSAVVVNRDGLAAGTYYIRVNTYYTSEWAPYTLADSLFVPTQANDAEPNDTKVQALTLPVNSSKTGHVNYYYNLVKDGQDWYKLTTTSDGNINIAIASNNGQNVWAYLYDNDGTTLIGSGYSSSSTNYNVDGLSAGTYYIKINNYYTSEFAPYTLSNTFTPYSNTNDPEPNGSAYQAKTLPANTASTGHVNFYYNLVKDGVDWFKINYTGTGALTLNMTQEAHKNNSGFNNFWVYVYKDTAAAPVASQYSSAASWSMNLSSLTQGYYWVKINTYYTSEYASYSITPTFTQDNIATISYNNPGTIAAPNCDSTNTVAFKCAGSNAPYTVQLFRFGVPYGNPRIVNNTNVFSFTGLPNGSYLARVFGDGATGTAFGSAPSRALEPVPGNAATGVITATSAKVTFDNFTCVDGYRLQHRKVGDINWIYDTVLKSPNTLRNLTPSTQYEWQVVSGDTLGTYTAISELSTLQTFTTLSAFSSTTGDNSDVTAANTGAKGLMVYPNPTSVQFKIQYNSNTNAKLSATLKDMNGKTVWSKLNIAATAINGTTVDVSKLQPGIYILQVAGTNNSMAETRKIVVSR